jgi:hypothetical protein
VARELPLPFKMVEASTAEASFSKNSNATNRTTSLN